MLEKIIKDLERQKELTIKEIAKLEKHTNKTGEILEIAEDEMEKCFLMHYTGLIEKLKNIKIEIPLSEGDLFDLQNGAEFDWRFDGVDVRLFNEDK